MVTTRAIYADNSGRVLGWVAQINGRWSWVTRTRDGRITSNTEASAGLAEQRVRAANAAERSEK